MSTTIPKIVNVRKISKERLSAFRNFYPLKTIFQEGKEERENEGSTELTKFLAYAGYQIHWRKFLMFSVTSGLSLLFLGLFINRYFSIVAFSLGLYLPFYLAKRAEVIRANSFAEEYPSVLLAMASNMKAGLTVYASLERSIMLLAEDSIVRKETKCFLENISRGMPTDLAITRFGENINLQELELFRRAFALVVVNGGRFSRTLERLAQVCRDRENLIKASKVSTASMRMTSNVLLVVAPTLIFVLSIRNKDFWEIFFNNSTAFTLGMIGVFTIIVSIASLRKMSDFKP